MSTLRKALHLILFAALVALPLAAQLTDCAFTRTFTGDLNAASSSNISGNVPCVNWRITFSVSPPPDNLTSTVTFQTSPDNTNWTSVPNTICSATVQPPCILQGTNPLTGTTQGMSLFAAYGSYVRVITSGSAGTGTGTIRGYGSKGATASASGIGGGGSGPVIPSTTNLLAGDGAGGVSDGGVTPTTSVGTPGVDTKVPTEKAVRTALAALLGFQATDPSGACTAGSGPNIQNTTTGTQFACVGGFWAQVIGASSSGQLVYYLTNTASSIATYLQATPLPFSPKTTLSFTALATGTDTLQNWATNANIPALTFIPTGVFRQHIHALRTGGGTVTLHAQFWEVDSAGVDIGMIGQTEDSPALGTGEIEYALEFSTANVYVMASSASRVVSRVFAVVSGSAPTVQIFVGGTADSSLALPSNSVDVTNFVPYIGATATVDLGIHDLVTGAGNLGPGVDARTGNTTPQTKLVTWGGNMVVGDPATLGTESLTNGALTSGTSWSRTGDFALTGNAAVYTHSSGTGTIVQANADLAVKLVDNRWYKLVYTISAVTAGTALSLPAAICDTAFSCAFDSTAGVAKVFYWKSATGASALAFTITGTSTAGGLTLDDLSLKEVQGGNAVVYGLMTGGGTAGIKVLSNGNAGFAGELLPMLSIDATGAGRFQGAAYTNIHGAGTEVGYIAASNFGFVSAVDRAGGGAVPKTLLLNTNGGTVGAGMVNGQSFLYSLEVSRGVGIAGTARFFDQTTTTGSTLVVITLGASQTVASKVLDVGGNIRLGSTNSTAAVAGVIGNTCPAITCTVAYTWVQAISSDNSVVYFPVWK